MKKNNVKLPSNFEPYFSKRAYIDLQLTVQIERSSGFHRKRLNLAIKDLGVVDLFACQTLNVSGNDSFVLEDKLISNSFERGDNNLVI